LKIIIPDERCGIGQISHAASVPAKENVDQKGLGDTPLRPEKPILTPVKAREPSEVSIDTFHV
jgi:hypothetical protein